MADLFENWFMKWCQDQGKRRLPLSFYIRGLSKIIYLYTFEADPLNIISVWSFRKEIHHFNLKTQFGFEFKESEIKWFAGYRIGIRIQWDPEFLPWSISGLSVSGSGVKKKEIWTWIWFCLRRSWIRTESGFDYFLKPWMDICMIRKQAEIFIVYDDWHISLFFHSMLTLLFT